MAGGVSVLSHYPLFCPHSPQVLSHNGPCWSMPGLSLYLPAVSSPGAASGGGATSLWFWPPRAHCSLGEPGHRLGGYGPSGLGCLLQCPGPFLRKEPRLRPAHYSHPRLTVGERATASAFFLPLRLGRPLTHLGALEHAGGTGLSWKLVFLQGTSHVTSAEPSRIQGGPSAAAVAESLACSWPWQGCSHG